MNLESFAAPLPARSSLKNHHIRQKIWQKLKKMLVQLTFNLPLKAHYFTRHIQSRLPDPSLVYTYTMIP